MGVIFHGVERGLTALALMTPKHPLGRNEVTAMKTNQDLTQRESWKPSTLGVLAVTMGALLGVGTAPLGAGAGQAGAAGSTDRLLAGSIDFHAHGLPDMEERTVDSADLARMARDRGMRGLVLKNHFDPTASLVYTVRRQVPGIEVFGGIVLNRTVGGINARAVEHMTQVTGGWGRVVWFPTRDAEHAVAGDVAEDPSLKRPFVSVSKDGELLPEVKDVIAVIAEHQLVLQTGHSSPEESLLLLAEGKRQGVQHMMVTHGAFEMSLAQMREAVQLGAFIEFVYRSIPTTDGASARWSPPELAELLRTIGVEWCVLSSDLGSPRYVMPTEGFGEFLLKMLEAGMTERELAQMTKDNPARLLGLPV